MPTIGPIWQAKACDEEAAGLLAAALKIEPAVARLLCQRGLGDPDLALRFLNPSLEHLHDPMLSPTCVYCRSHHAAVRKERIAIHGDYDVDGVTSTVILRRALELLGADVMHFIPSACGTATASSRRRSIACTEGVAYRLGRLRHPRRRRRLRRARARRRSDHHRSPRTGCHAPRPADQPKRHDCQPLTNTAGVGVALKGAGALSAPGASWLPGFVKIAAIGMADVVPLVGENRVIAKIGLDLLSAAAQDGLRAADVAGPPARRSMLHIRSWSRHGLCGRAHDTPDISTRLLLAVDDDVGEVRALAMQLDGENVSGRKKKLYRRCREKNCPDRS